MKDYLELKHELLRRNLLSCSETGFNIARGEFALQADRLRRRLLDALPERETWKTPPLIRADWIEHSAWETWLGHRLTRSGLGGHVLSPKPVAHLLNRLRHHPEQAAAYLLWGPAFRDVGDTLPLYRQIAFNQLEAVTAGRQQEVLGGLARDFATWRSIADGLGLAYDVARDRMELSLNFTDRPPVAVVSAALLDPVLASAYGLADITLGICSTSIERCCLSWIAGHGADPAGWPALD
jgi:hypothetical protein